MAPIQVAEVEHYFIARTCSNSQGEIAGQRIIIVHDWYSPTGFGR